MLFGVGVKPKTAYLHNDNSFGGDLPRFVEEEGIEFMFYVNVEINPVRKLRDFKGFHVVQSETVNQKGDLTDETSLHRFDREPVFSIPGAEEAQRERTVDRHPRGKKADGESDASIAEDFPDPREEQGESLPLIYLSQGGFS